MSEAEKPKLNASQRLETLEVNVQELLMHLNSLAQDNLMFREFAKLMGSKVAVMQRLAGISDDVIAAGMLENSINDLKKIVDDFIARGVMVASDVVTETTFVVGKELTAEGEVTDVRKQFAVGKSNDLVRSKIIGAKVGDLVVFSEDTLNFIVEEIYEIVMPKVEEAPAEEAAPQA